MINKVSEFKDLASGVVYKSNNYKMFKTLSGNRGETKGVENSRVNGFVKLIKNGLFLSECSYILVNRNRVKLDGNNRSLALERCGESISFIITDDPMLNTTNQNDLLNAIALLNGKNSAWSQSHNFRSSLIKRVPMAVQLDKLRSEMVMNYNIGSGELTPSLMYGILNKKLNVDKKLRSIYDDKALTKVSKSVEFENDLMFVSSVIRFFKGTNIRSHKIYKWLMPLVWSGKIDRDSFYHNLVKYGFDVVSERKQFVLVTIDMLANKRISKGTKIVSWK